MLASSSRTSLKRVHSQLCSAATSKAERSFFSSFSNYTSRRHNTTQAKTINDEAVPSPHLIASQGRIFGSSGDTTTQQALTRTTSARLKMQLVTASNFRRYAQCLGFAKEMKDLGHRPDLVTYTTLMHASSEGHWLDSWAILEDMETIGVKPDVNLFNALLKAQSRCNTRHTWQVLDKMQELGIAPNASTYDLIVSRFLVLGNLELAIQYFWSMERQHIVPEFRTAQLLINTAAQSGHPKLALDLAAWYESVSVRRLDHAVWMTCLIASAKALYTHGTILCWKKVVHELKITPGEGICLAVLDTAARSSLPDLATDVIRVIKIIGVDWQEHHFAPLIEAFSRQGQMKEALQVLAIMRKEKVDPLPQTTHILSEAMGNTEAVDSMWGIIDELHAGGTKVDITVLQALIRASVKLGDLQRAIGAYKGLADYGASADLVIYNQLLQGCVQASHRDLGNLLLVDMKAGKVKPNQETYEIFISLCLTQDDYEDAFFYLEEMKAAGFLISSSVYTEIIEKCIASNDPRFKIALEEMKERGHEPSSALYRVIRQASSSEHGNSFHTPNGDVSVAAAATIDGAAQRFIETGGLEGKVELSK